MRFVTAAIPASCVQASHGPRAPNVSSRYSRWSPTQIESKPIASPSRAIAAISGQRTSRSTSGSWKPTFSGRVRLCLLDLVGLDDVAFLEVLVALDANAAVESCGDVLDVIIDALHSSVMA